MQCVSGVGWEGHFSCFNPTDPTHSSHWSWPTKLTQSYRCSRHSSNQSSTVRHKKPGSAPHMTWWNWVLWPVSRTTTETCPVTWPETWYRYSTTPLTEAGLTHFQANDSWNTNSFGAKQWSERNCWNVKAGAGSGGAGTKSDLEKINWTRKSRCLIYFNKLWFLR